jgi:hypothetical protein
VRAPRSTLPEKSEVEVQQHWETPGKATPLHSGHFAEPRLQQIENAHINNYYGAIVLNIAFLLSTVLVGFYTHQLNCPHILRCKKWF